jgi:hypothetical protein
MTANTEHTVHPVQAGFNSPAPSPPPTLPASLLAAFAASNSTGFDNGTLLTSTPATPSPQSPDTTNTTANGTGEPRDPIQTELLSLSVKPDYLVPLKVVTGISSSFITNLLKPQGTIGRELTGTEVLK